MQNDSLAPSRPGHRRRPPLAQFATPALLCAVLVIASILIAHPYAELGISDDFSYIRSAQILAQTGHIVYNGWATAFLSWQLYLAAFFIKLFGFSFTTVRASIMFLAACTAYLCQRTFVRAGLTEWNATIATITLTLSPLCLPLEVTFMSDIPGLFATVLCLYLCLRAIEAAAPRTAIAWIGFAALSNSLLGSARQIAWLGTLVMVPSALWLLRRRRNVLLAGTTLWLISLAVFLALNSWFQHRPYMVIDPLVPSPITPHILRHLATNMLRAVFELVLLLLPVLLMFLPALWRKKHPWPVYILGLLFLAAAFHYWHIHTLHVWNAPYLMGIGPFAPLTALRPMLAIAVLLCMLALLSAILLRRKKTPFKTSSDTAPSIRTLCILILPYTLGYIGLVSPLAAFATIWDRYIIPVLFLALILLVRFYQRHIRSALPMAALLLALSVGAYATLATHDAFVTYRAHLTAFNEVLATGVPPTKITGGWDVDGWTELQYSSHVNGHDMRIPPGTPPTQSTHYGLAHCALWYCDLNPHVIPQYTTATHPDPSLGDKFAPVPFHTLLYSGTVYIDRFPADTEDGGLSKK